MLDYINTNIELLDALNMAYTIYKFPTLETKQIHIPLTELADDMNYGGEVGWVFIMDRKQNTEVLHDFVFYGIEPDESKFDYDYLRKALNEYRTGEWMSDSISEDLKCGISDEIEDNQNDEEYIYDEWD